MNRTPATIPMQQAVAAIQALARPSTAGMPVIIGITGPVGAGKTTLAGRLSGCIISTDHYLPDYDTTPEHEWDLPERADLARLLVDLTSLRAGRPTAIPQWSFHTHSRVGETLITPHELIVVEGLHALHHTHAPALDIRVYVDAPAPMRLERWEHLSRTGQRGWDLEVTRSFFRNVAEPTFHTRSPHYRASAHVIVANNVQTPLPPSPPSS